MRILIWDEREKTAQPLDAFLRRRGYSVIEAGSPEEAFKLLATESTPPLAILAPKSAGTASGFCKKIKQLPARLQPYLLLITPPRAIVLGPEWRDAGADDCLSEPYDSRELEMRVRLASRVMELQQSLVTSVSMDPLTGVSHHEAILNTLRRELVRAGRTDSLLAVLMADLDHFKSVNDTFGHPAGDGVLREIVHRMLSVLRAYDTLGRYGGEEFLVVLPGCDSSTAVSIANRIRESVVASPFQISGNSIGVTLSIGVAVTRGQKIAAEVLVELADQALYRAKAAGRNRVELALGSAEEAGSLTPEMIQEQLKNEIEVRKRTEETLRKLEERFRLIGKATADALWDQDLLTNQIWWNEGGRTLFGYSEIVEEARWWRERIHPEDRERVLSVIDTAVSKREEFWSAEYRYRRANGTYADVLDRGYIIYDQDQPVRMMGVTIDMTQRRSIEKALYETQLKYKALVEQLPAITYTAEFGANGRWMYVSPQIEEIVGYSQEEWLAEPGIFRRLVHVEDFDDLFAREEKSLRTGDMFVCEYRMKSRDGRLLWFSDEATVLKDETGKPLFLQGIMRDITESKRADLLQSALYRISEATNAAQDMQDLFRTIHAIIAEFMDARNFYIALYDAGTRMISFPYFIDEFDPGPVPQMAAGRGLTAYVLRSGEPLWAPPEVFEDLCRKGEVELAGPPSIDWLGVPLKTAGETLGVLVVQSYTESVRFGEKDKELLTFVSQHIATALKRKKAEEALRESEQRFMTFMDNYPAAAYIRTLSGEWLYGNKHFKKLRNDQVELIGKTDSSDTSAGQKTAQQKVLMLENSDGSSNYWLVVEFPFSNIKGEVLLGGIALEISDRKYAEELHRDTVENI